MLAFPWPCPPLLSVCGWNSIAVSWNKCLAGCFLTTSAQMAGSHPSRGTQPGRAGRGLGPSPQGRAPHPGPVSPRS